jgi:4-hydroxy-3-methylbut-2-en-1-yl diphosphate reductase
MRILLAGPRACCAGVNMAIEALERAIERFGTPLYVFHEIVHNRHVVERFVDRGVVFIDHIRQVPHGAHLMYSAHGVSPAVQREARERQLHVIDATCPLVRKVHVEAAHFASQGYTIVLIGHAGHDEVIGTLGQAPHCMRLVETPADVDALIVPDPDKVAYLTQTTLSVDDANAMIERLRGRFPKCVGAPKEDICYATQNRQEALKTLLPLADVVLVVGSRTSSNSNRLAEIARSRSPRTYQIDSAVEIDAGWFGPDETVLITAGASAPDYLVTGCVEHLRSRFTATVDELRVREERVEFPLPVEVR